MVGESTFERTDSKQKTTTMTTTTNDERFERNSTITVSDYERELVREAAKDLFGTDEVTYGTTLTRLVDEATDVPVEEN